MSRPSRLLPPALLVVLLGVHLALNLQHLQHRHFVPPVTNHNAHLNVLAIERLLEGLQPVLKHTHPGCHNFFLGEPAPTAWAHPAVLWREWTEGRLRGVWRNNCGVTYWVERPVAFLAGAIVALISPDRMLGAALSPTLYLFLMLVAVYGIGKQVKDGWTGLTAAVLVSGYPAVAKMGWVIHDAIPTAAMGSVLIWLLLKSRGLSRLWPALLFGPLWWLGSRTGESFSGFGAMVTMTAGPLALEVFTFLRRARTRPAILRGLLALTVMVGVPLLVTDWHWVRGAMGHTLWGLEDYSMSANFVPGASPEEGGGWIFHTAYELVAFNSLLRPLLTAWTLLGLLLLARADASRRLSLLLWLLGPWLALHAMRRQATWYLVPFLPALATCAAVGLRGLRPSWARRLLPALAAASALGMLLVFPHLERHLPPWWRAPTGDLVFMRDVDVHSMEQPMRPQQRAAVRQVVEYFRSPLLPGQPPPEQPSGHSVIGLVCLDGAVSSSFRYLLEQQAPHLLVVDLLSNHLFDAHLGSLKPSDIHYFVYLDESGLARWQPSQPGGVPAHLAPRLRHLQWVDGRQVLTFLRAVQRPGLRELPLPEGVIYRVGD